MRYPEGHPQAGQQMGGNQKMRMYQQGLRQHMHGLGYEVELDVSERAHESLDKDRYAAEDGARRVLEADQKALATDQQALNTDREKYVVDAALLGRAQKNFRTAIAEYEGELEIFQVAKEQVESDAGDVIALADKLAKFEKELQDREVVLEGREQTVQSEKALLPELKRKARTEGYQDGRVQGLQAAQEAAEEAGAEIRAQAAADAQRIVQQAVEAAQQVCRDAEAEAEQKRRQADLKVAEANEHHARAKEALDEAGEVKAEAEIKRRAAGTTMAEAKDTLNEARQLLHSAQEIAPPQINENDFKQQMNTVDADFLDKLCEKNPQIAQNRENYRDRRRREVQWGTPQQREALTRTVGQAQQLARKRFGGRPDGPASPQRGRQHGSGPEYR